ncbi:RNA polymerase sigma factor region1.1 domain-containing protein [Thiohalophilus thiocyanatoxydans]|uniref:RNA polymerase sigma factor region1.1 domain-containing protein n=1 Tax=Thiohalophilus thiocyanatoxydans TaxID=381308 RepID=UPI001417017F|nr:RNA polymerase sigma factor region1.1 domain-containing protein [Thiohalophilus thiocyanatoxydans]
MIAKEIIEKGREQGYLLKSEIMEMLPNEADSPEGLELIFEMIRHMGIEVRD